MRTQNDRSKKLETALPSLNWHRLSLLHQEAEADTGVESQTEEPFLIALINSAFYFAAVCDDALWSLSWTPRAVYAL